jgi:carbon monoxide dehydrogenase subunit G
MSVLTASHDNEAIERSTAMQLEQQFTIPTDIEHAWKILNDVEGIAPCFPGATVLSATEESVNGQVKVKLGPVMLTYAGVLKFLERDDANHFLVMDGQGVDAKGNGSASAKVTAHLSELPDGSTQCDLVTDLNITGRPAQFGRGMMLEIGNNILGKFSKNLAAMLSEEKENAAASDVSAATMSTDTATADVMRDTSSGPSAKTMSASSFDEIGRRRAAAPGARKAAPAQDDTLDLLAAAGGATLKRAIPVLVLVAVIVAVIIWLLAR